ncbi:MAG: DNA translocase FtsK 4TM domain-containing protein [Desulfosarcinaceae bacterium]|nr:DNA translocase FtsK 4TM domain-containing protein [Desulfosarcinaceae bacterium]
MRKELAGICLFFLVVFTLISILSYSSEDPSIFHHTGGAGPVVNLFGVLGAHVGGLLIGLFGLGAFWVPVLLLLASLNFFGKHPIKAILPILGGGILLILATGGLFAIQQEQYLFFGQRFTAGGILGSPLKAFLLRYTNVGGGVFILCLLWLVGFILSTGFSLIVFYGRLQGFIDRFGAGIKTVWLKRRERRNKAKKRTEAIKRRRTEGERPVKIKARAPKPKPLKTPVAPKQDLFDFMHKGQGEGYRLPSINFLDDPEPTDTAANAENLQMQSKLLEKKLEDFGVNGQVVAVSPGPVVTTFEYAPAPGVKINKIVNLTDDLALALRAISIRIVAPIPGKAAIGIEIPNPDRETVRFKEIVTTETFQNTKSELTLCLGKDIIGHPVAAELDKMPHLLIAGATGSGKSVALNTMICSFLYKATPESVKMIMVDPKRIELSMYDGIPHLITPVVTDVKKATNALFWAVKEMERRYQLLSDHKARNIRQYNAKVEKAKKAATKAAAKAVKTGVKSAAGDSAAPADAAAQAPANAPPLAELEHLPLIVIIIDELADLMMVASRDVEVALTRLAQMARAAGIHLILATQRPSVDVLTGIIKANFPTRLSFQVSSKTDSRTIIDTNGAENLLGMGDMLFLPPGAAKLQRIHGAFISEAELARITEFLKSQQKPEYVSEVLQTPAKESGSDGEKEYDERYDDAVALVTKTGQASISMIQRHLRIGYNRAARIVEMMEEEGVVGPSDGVKPREVLARNYDDMP